MSDIAKQLSDEDMLVEKRSFTAGRPYTICFDWNALCAFQLELGVNLWEQPRIPIDPVGLRQYLAIGLRRYHPGITLEEAGSLLGVMHGKAIHHLLLEALVGSLPEPSEDEGEKQPDPPSA